MRESATFASQGWLFVAPALTAYAVFVLWPLIQTFKYSLYQWDGVVPARWVGLANFKTVFTDHDLLAVLGHAFELIIFFSGIPVVLGLVVATVMRRIASRRIGAAARAVLFLPQVVPLVAAGIAWSWVLSSTGVVNQMLKAVGLGSVTRAWLGDFGTALPAVGVIGAWVLLGLCTVLLLAGMAKIDPSLYEAAQLDGAGPGPRVPLDHVAEPAPGDRRLRHRHRDRGLVGLRHRLHRHARRPWRPDDGAGPRDLPAGVLQPPGRARLGARRRADAARADLHPPDPVATPGEVPTRDRLPPEHMARRARSCSPSWS